MNLWGVLPFLCAACSFNSSVPVGGALLDDGGIAATDSGPPGASLPDGIYRKSISLNPEGLTEDLSDFVVAVVLEDDTDLAARAQPDASDIHFTSPSGQRLEFEIEEFATASGKLVAWVKVPTLSMTEPNSIYLYYGENSVTHDSMPTWSGGFAGVWHFSEDPTVPMPSFSDSVTATFPATAEGSRRPSQASGIAGPCLSFDGIDDNLDIEGSGDSGLDFGTASFSYSTWVFVSDVVGSFDMPWWKGGASAGQGGYDIELGTNNWTAYVSDGGGNGDDIVGANFGNLVDFVNRWVHLVVVVNREAGELRVFADGMRKATRALGTLGSLSTSNAASISRPAYIFRGRIDETRVYRLPLSDSWVRTVHANLSAPATFLTLGPEEGATPN
jgi:hypothetical protein